MKPFSHLVRRTHLYLALFCLPWFVMYGLTSMAFSHAEWFAWDRTGNAWIEEGSWPCTLAVPAEGDLPRALAAELVGIAGIDEKAFGIYRVDEHQIEVYIVSFWQRRRLLYHTAEQRLTLYQRKAPPEHILTGMHARAGYQHDGLLNDAWAVMVDLVAVGFLLWVVTGLYIWWQMPGLRVWGAVGLLAGVLSFIAFLVLL